MAERITKNYKVAANGLLTIDDGRIYISIEDGPQEVDFASLLTDFDGRVVKLNCTYDEECVPEAELSIDVETGEVI